MVSKNDERAVMAMQARAIQDRARRKADAYIERITVPFIGPGVDDPETIKRRWVRRYQIERRKAAGL